MRNRGIEYRKLVDDEISLLLGEHETGEIVFPWIIAGHFSLVYWFFSIYQPHWSAEEFLSEMRKAGIA